MLIAAMGIVAAVVLGAFALALRRHSVRIAELEARHGLEADTMYYGQFGAWPAPIYGANSDPELDDALEVPNVSDVPDVSAWSDRGHDRLLRAIDDPDGGIDQVEAENSFARFVETVEPADFTYDRRQD